MLFVSCSSQDNSDSQSVGLVQPTPTIKFQDSLQTPETRVNDVKIPEKNNNMESKSVHAGKNSFEECVLVNEIFVKEVLTGNEAIAICDSDEFFIEYVGVNVIHTDLKKSDRAKSLNEFLVLGKEIDVDVISVEGSDGLGARYSVELYSEGESVNLRLIDSGLVGIGDFPSNFERTDLFKKRFSQAKMTDNSIIVPAGPANNSFGCGTLPCRPKN